MRALDLDRLFGQARITFAARLGTSCTPPATGSDDRQGVRDTLREIDAEFSQEPRTVLTSWVRWGVCPMQRQVAPAITLPLASGRP